MQSSSIACQDTHPDPYPDPYSSTTEPRFEQLHRLAHAIVFCLLPVSSSLVLMLMVRRGFPLLHTCAACAARALLAFNR